MKQILINASQREEVRLAIVEDNKLTELDIDLPSKNIKSNIYKGTISRVEPSLEAAFVNFGRTRHGFLPFKEIAEDIFVPGKSRSARDCIEPGKEIVIQVDKEERGSKGAALTTFLSLAGKYLVLLPKNPNTGGVSRRLEGNDRMSAKKLLSELDIPENMSIILRTSGLDSTKETLEWDMNYLIQIYEQILESSVLKKAPFLIYEESSMLARVIRDYINETVQEVIIDDEKYYNNFINGKDHFIPHSKIKIEHYTKSVPLFSNFGIEGQVQSVYRKKVTLPSGGNIVFDTTEALTSIDVNSAKSTKGGDIEETALNTNLEAADSLAVQLRLRDIGGLIVVDFIDMMSLNSQKSVMSKMAHLSKIDKAKMQFTRISKFGLMEISRQKLKSSIIDNNTESCPTCGGSGDIKSLSTLSINLARLLEEEAMKTDKPMTVYLPVRLATYLLNEKKEIVEGIEKRQKIDVKIMPDNTIEGANYLIDKKNMETEAFKASIAKHNNKDKKTLNETSSHYEEALVKAVTPKSVPPKPSIKQKKPFNHKKKSIFKKVIDFFKSLIGLKPKKVYRGRQFNGRRKYNNKNNYSKYSNNKYKSFNKKKPYFNKNNNSAKKSSTAADMKKNKNV
ncbi:MAG: Rne/Rng family ribonuclease [Gammaproteobacteria bacterium]|nr:Rne/Rng family ribonuclease [Gammaproteobacteria bacterium]MBT4461920.1 Rne/Rng family ribonuclease [Gammaproteobacteria bacterium]MBT4654309.1 Rne/Rng family ribonuclease [Gammaproteobacteria bacterium]MBT7931968.1 Rne/Rng family ribonuclease [Gammaproteobacteria bacterium]